MIIIINITINIIYSRDLLNNLLSSDDLKVILKGLTKLSYL